MLIRLISNFISFKDFSLQMSGFVLQVLWENVLKFAESQHYIALAIVIRPSYIRTVRGIVLQHTNHITMTLTPPISGQ